MFRLQVGITLCFSLKDPASNIQVQRIYGMAKTYRLGILLLTESTLYPTVEGGFIVDCINYAPLDLYQLAI